MLASTAGEIWIWLGFGDIFTPGASKGLRSFYIQCNSVPLCWHVCVHALNHHSFHGATPCNFHGDSLTSCNVVLAQTITPCPGPAGHRNVVVSQPCNSFGVSPCLNSLVYRRIRVDLQHWWGPGQHFLWLQWGTIFGDIIYWGFLVCVFFVAFLFFLVWFSLFGSFSVWVLLFACSLVVCLFFFPQKNQHYNKIILGRKSLIDLP